jgi:hypothetical protein
MNQHLARAADKANKDQRRRLAICGHEIGHALGELAGGGQPEWVKLKFGMLGGISGWCRYGCDPERGWPKDRKIGRLVAMMAGHAAEVRFCRLYLGMDHRTVFRYGRDWADGDYEDFRYWRSKLGLGWSITPQWAFEQATGLLGRQGGRLDALTVRLDHAKYLPGSAL